MPLKVEKQRASHKATISLFGELDFHTSSELRIAMEQVVGVPGLEELVLDLRGLKLIDSSGLGMLLFASKEMEKRKAKVSLLTNQLVTELLEITHLDKFFEMGDGDGLETKD
ncbi:MAG: STAS domain-containing protein [Chloroflexi bacterium]|nr:STAS domain-containing protein [Chloroflexota bacterium]